MSAPTYRVAGSPFGYDLGAAQGIFSAPIGLNEMVLAVWLIVKGFAPEGGLAQ